MARRDPAPTIIRSSVFRVHAGIIKRRILCEIGCSPSCWRCPPAHTGRTTNGPISESLTASASTGWATSSAGPRPMLTPATAALQRIPQTGDAYRDVGTLPRRPSTRPESRTGVGDRFQVAGSKQVYLDRQPVEETGELPALTPYRRARRLDTHHRCARSPVSASARPHAGPPGVSLCQRCPISSEQLIEAQRGENIRDLVPAYSSYLVIGAAGLFLLGLFFFDRSQKAAFWLGLYCVAVCITRLNMMGSFVLWETTPAISKLLSSVSRCLSRGRWFASILLGRSGGFPPFTGWSLQRGYSYLLDRFCRSCSQRK